MSLLTNLNYSIKKSLKKTCKSLGRNNDALYAVLAIALFKGIMRPTFTMMDKKSDKKTKQYAAFREGLTEAIAFGSYILTHKLVLPLATPLCKAANAMEKKDKVAKGLSLFSVCLSAAVIIPALCNLTLKPIMNMVSKVSETKKDMANEKAIDERALTGNNLDIKEKSDLEKPNTTTPINNLQSPHQTGNLLTALQKTSMQNSAGMKVGG